MKKLYDIFIVLLALISIVLVITDFCNQININAVLYVYIDNGILIIFAVNYFTRLFLAKDKDLIHSALSEIQNVSNKAIEITDILTNKLGLQEELQNVAKISTEKLNSQYISLNTDLKELESQQKLNLAKLAQTRKTNN